MKIALQIKANLENVTDFGPDGDDFRWYIKYKCLNCGEATDKWNYVSVTESLPTKGGRGEANLVVKCKLCSRENTLSIMKDSVSKYSVDDSGSFKTMVVFECRGLEPTEYSPRTGFAAKGAESNTKFPNINMEEKEWVDYDEKSQESVGIYDLEFQFTKA